MNNHTRLFLLLTAGLALTAASAPAQDASRVTPMAPDVMDSCEQVLPSADFIRRDTMVPMRDGTRLCTVIVMKKRDTQRADPVVP